MSTFFSHAVGIYTLIDMTPERIGAFVEYVMRPMSEDWRQILDQLKSLNIGITQETIKEVTFALGLWHLTGEVIRAATYVVVVWMVCQVVVHVL